MIELAELVTWFGDSRIASLAPRPILVSQLTIFLYPSGGAFETCVWRMPERANKTPEPTSTSSRLVLFYEMSKEEFVRNPLSCTSRAAAAVAHL